MFGLIVESLKHDVEPPSKQELGFEATQAIRLGLSGIRLCVSWVGMPSREVASGW